MISFLYNSMKVWNFRHYRIIICRLICNNGPIRPYASEKQGNNFVEFSERKSFLQFYSSSVSITFAATCRFYLVASGYQMTRMPENSRDRN